MMLTTLSGYHGKDPMREDAKRLFKGDGETFRDDIDADSLYKANAAAKREPFAKGGHAKSRNPVYGVAHTKHHGLTKEQTDMKLPKHMKAIPGTRRKLEKETTTQTYADGGLCGSAMHRGHDDLNGSHGGDTHWPMNGEKPMARAKGGLMSKMTAKVTHRACGGMGKGKIHLGEKHGMHHKGDEMPPRIQRATGGMTPKAAGHHMAHKASEAKAAIGGKKMHTMKAAVERAAGGHMGHENLRGDKGGATSYPMRGMKPLHKPSEGSTTKKLAIGGIGKFRHNEMTKSGKPVNVPKRQPRGA
jgi:hypothetical protein